MVRIPSVASLLLVAAGCTASSPAPSPPPTSAPAPPVEGNAVSGSSSPASLPESPPSTPWSVVVLDGSANRFALEGRDGGARHTFTPVTPATSSSGVYSGGDPRAGDVDAATAASLWRLARAALLDPSRHVSARAMGTVVVRVDVGGEVREAIVKMGGADELLAALRAIP